MQPVLKAVGLYSVVLVTNIEAAHGGRSQIPCTAVEHATTATLRSRTRIFQDHDNEVTFKGCAHNGALTSVSLPYAVFPTQAANASGGVPQHSLVRYSL